jgi:hypothetical protein
MLVETIAGFVGKRLRTNEVRYGQPSGMTWVNLCRTSQRIMTFTVWRLDVPAAGGCATCVMRSRLLPSRTTMWVRDLTSRPVRDTERAGTAGRRLAVGIFWERGPIEPLLDWYMTEFPWCEPFVTEFLGDLSTPRPT